MNGNLPDALARTEHWYAAQGWTLFDFQREAWQAWHAGESGLIHSPTGSGKTLAAWLGPVQAALSSANESNGNDSQDHDTPDGNVRLDTARDDASSSRRRGRGLEVLWITPLRALATDTRRSLETAVDALANDTDPELRVELRTGDTSSHRRKQQRDKPPFALVTTPESLSVMLTHPDARIGLAQVHTVIVDEWHELMASKRGVLLQLALARVRAMRSDLRIWGLSATLANLDESLGVLIGPERPGRLIRGVVPRNVEIDIILPASMQRFPWSGHYGTRNVTPVIEACLNARTTLVFTNTRAQAEIWFQAMLNARPELVHDIALHHGSIDREIRVAIEDRLRAGTIRCVVCTSSLDLGVDFSPVEQVIQIGSPKGVARLLQRAGRSGHRPGAVSRVLCVPTNALEIVEFTAARRALAANRIEEREPIVRALDVLCQHLVTVALGEGFEAQEMLAEVRLTHCFHGLTDTDWSWVMDFITRGGQALQGYPQYHKVIKVAGLWRVMNEQVAQRHRTAIGTIASDVQMSVSFLGGKRLGQAPESFIAKLARGDTFQFAGRHLELLQVKDLTAHVRLAKKRNRAVPQWGGTSMPLSSQLADSVLETLEDWREGRPTSPEIDRIADWLNVQRTRSVLPGPGDFLIEKTRTREGHSLFFYPFAGRLAHEGLSMLVAQRLSETRDITFTLQINDYGFELMSAEPIEFSESALRPAFRDGNLANDILASINAGQLTQRRFRDIARIAGLVYEGQPGRRKSARQVQVSSGLIFEVLRDFDADNLLLDQARREVLEAQLEFTRLQTTLTRIATRRWHLIETESLTPLSFPLWAESIQSQTLGSESVQQRIERMLGALDDEAGAISAATS